MKILSGGEMCGKNKCNGKIILAITHSDTKHSKWSVTVLNDHVNPVQRLWAFVHVWHIQS